MMNCVNGNAGNNTLSGNGGNNCIRGNGGNDSLSGAGGKDTLKGGSGNDTLRGGPGNDILNGGGGADRFHFRNITSIIHESGNKYTVVSQDGSDIIQDLRESSGDRIWDTVQKRFRRVGNAGGTPGGGTPPGGNGNVLGRFNFTSFFQATGGPVVPFTQFSNPVRLELSELEESELPFTLFDGGSNPTGHHAVVLNITPTSQFGFQQEVFLAENTNAAQFIDITSNNSTNFKQVVVISLDEATPEATRIFGTDESEVLLGTSRNDAILGLDGHDTLRGKGRDDLILGGLGNDDIFGGTGADSLYGNSGRELIVGGSGDDILNGGADNDTLNGGSGNDSIFGWTGNDLLRGGAADDFLSGDLGNDTVNGGMGEDTLQGGAGNDVLNGGADQDLLFERGTSFQLTNNRLIGLGDDTLSSIEMVHLIGRGTDDHINASLFTKGRVTLSGEAGDDTLRGGSAGDFLEGKSGRDRIIGGDGNDTINGGFNNDILLGGVGSDAISGGADNDTLIGFTKQSGFSTLESQVDTLIGGSGADKFVLGNSTEVFYEQSGDQAVIQDFSFSDGDKIRVFGTITDYELSIVGSNTLVNYQGMTIAQIMDSTVILSRDFEFLGS